MSELLRVLRDPATIRARCHAVTDAVADDRSGLFRLDRSRLGDAADRVAALTRRRFPDLNVPFHSRWRHFDAGGVNRIAELDAQLAALDAIDQARARFDLALVSVLLDAGAGPGWRYRDEADGSTLGRSEGLAVASLRAFMAGRFSADPADPLRADGTALARIDTASLREIFQVTPQNVMVGLDGRAALLARLGAALQAEGGSARPALVFDRLTERGARRSVGAAELLTLLLDVLGPIWTSGSRVIGVPAGDVWPHRWAGSSDGHGGHDRSTGGWVPFHKLTQWLAYSLVEPLQWAGVEVTGLDALTGLPEYRNGGLLLDTGVIVPRQPLAAAMTLKPGDERVVEWRALTVTLLDELADLVRARLGVDASRLPLACVLEGGTWAAGREIAQEVRGGAPPLAIDSDGTLF